MLDNPALESLNLDDLFLTPHVSERESRTVENKLDSAITKYYEDVEEGT
jgi:hypothetical protein